MTRAVLRSNYEPGTSRWATRRAQWLALGLSDEDVPDAELAERRAALAASPPARPVEVGWLSVYQRLVRPLPEGAVLRPRGAAS